MNWICIFIATCSHVINKKKEYNFHMMDLQGWMKQEA